MSNSTVTRKPKQTISLKKKISEGEKGKAWRQQCVDYYADRNSAPKNNRAELEYLYKIAAGYLDTSKYTYITNPNNTNTSQKRNYPAKLRNYDIISPIIQMLIGELSKRKITPTVTAINSDITTIKEQTYGQLVTEQLEQQFINELNNYVDTGFISKDIMGYEEMITTVDGIKDEKSIMGQTGIDYILSNCELQRKFRELGTDFFISGYEFSQKGVEFDDVFYKTVTPANCNYVCGEDVTFIEDGEGASIKRQATVSEIVDEFNDVLTEEEIDYLESLDGHNNENRVVSYTDTDVFMHSMNSKGLLDYGPKDLHIKQGMHEILYVNWKSKLKIGLVKGINELGENYEYEVDETYVPLPEEDIEWRWVNQVWEGYRIANKYYKKVKPVEEQRGKFDNPSACKLLINGRNLHGRHYYVKSIVKKLEAYQERYNAVHWHLEKVMNKNKDKITVLPKSLVPTGKGFNMFDMMYFADADGFLFLDEVDNSKLAALNAVKVLDMSLRDYLKYLYELLAAIKQEAEDLIGVNRQRKGQVFSSDGKGMNEQAIYQSSVMTEEYFLEHEEFIERELQGLLDISKYAWRKGKKKTFIDSDKRQRFLDILGQDYSELEFSVRVGNGRTESEAKTAIRNNIQAMLQNGGRHSTIAKLFKTENIDKMIDILEIEEQKMMQRQEQAQAQEQKLAMQQQQLEQQRHDDNIFIQKYKVDMDRLTELDKLDASDNSGIEQQKLDNERRKIEADLQIAREKNQTMLKNKVVGEK